MSYPFILHIGLFDDAPTLISVMDRMIENILGDKSA